MKKITLALGILGAFLLLLSGLILGCKSEEEKLIEELTKEPEKVTGISGEINTSPYLEKTMCREAYFPSLVGMLCGPTWERCWK